MQDSGMNPFAAASNLGRKRGADESGMDLGMPMSMSDAAPPASHGVMPLPKRRITDLNVPTMASLNSNGAVDPQAYHAYDALPHSPQYSLNLYPNNGNTPHAASPGVQTDAMSGYGYYSGTIAVSNPENGQVDPSSKHALRHIQMPSYNPSNPSSSLNSPSAHSVFTTTTDADAPFLFEHDSPDMMQDEDNLVDTQGQPVSNEEAMMAQQQQQMYMQQQQEQQMYFQQQQQYQQQMQGHPMLDPSLQQQQQQQQQNSHPLSSLAGTGMFTTQNPIQAAYDSYNGGFLDELDDSMAMRYTGQGGDNYAARLEGVMGHA